MVCLFIPLLWRGGGFGGAFGGYFRGSRGLGRRFSRGMRSSRMFCTTSWRGPAAGRFPLAIATNTAHIPATSLQESSYRVGGSSAVL